MTTLHEIPSNAIAIIGISGRFPGGNSAGAYWRNLLAGRDCITELSVEACLAAGTPPDQLNHPLHRRRIGVLDDIDQFDAEYFGLHQMESTAMDPQLRLALECAVEVLDDAGIDPARYAGSIGVYAGATDGSYLSENLQKHPNVMASIGPMKTMVGTSSAFLATQLAYKLNLRGPAISLQTACSTGGVASHMAIQSLLSGECDLAIAGAATIDVNQGRGYMHAEGGILARDGYCRPFDAAASGTIPGNGIGMVLLCRLADAVELGYPIYATIRGSAINNDGAQKVGFAAPSAQGQARVIAEALMVAEVSADTVAFVEAHGTGTALGDPIELAALRRVFRRDQVANGSCGIGSVKSNIGHLDSAAGMAGLIKVALALRHRIMPRSLHFNQPHPALDLANSPFYVLTENRTWPSVPRRAGVSAFGVGGTNAHLILEEAPELAPRPASVGQQVWPLSALSGTALVQMAQRLADALTEQAELRPDDVAHTLQEGRRVFPYRHAIVSDTLAGAIAQLRKMSSADVSLAEENPALAFVFPGQGSQVLGMGQQLYQHWSAFRTAFDECRPHVRRHADIDLCDLLYPDRQNQARAQAQLARTRYAQPAIFAVSYALAQAWQSAGVVPAALIGHSIGEWVAACLAGTFSLADALYLVCERAAAMDECEGEGAMLAVMAPAAHMRAWCGPELALAADNAPQRCVLSGTPAALAQVRAALTAQDIAFATLHTSHAFHGPLMAPAQRRLGAALAKVQKQPPQRPWISNRTGQPILPEQALSDEYWLAQMMEPVRFADGIAHLAQAGIRIFLEIGPGQAMTKLVLQNLDGLTQPARLSKPLALPSMSLPPSSLPEQPSDELTVLLAGSARLWARGVPLNWAHLPDHSDAARRVWLPTYPFQRQSYWLAAPVEPATAAPPRPEQAAAAQKSAHESAYGMAVRKTKAVSDWFYLHGWQRSPAARLLDHISIDSYRGVWLFISEPTGIAQALATRMASQGQQVITLRLGQQNARRADNEFEVCATQADSYAWLIGELVQIGQVPTNIVHMALATPATVMLDADSIALRGFASLTALVLALEAHAIRTLVNFSVIATHAMNVGGSDTVAPLRAATAGFCKSLPQDFKHLTAQFIDIDPLPVPGSVAATTLLDVLYDELCAIPYDQLIAYRGRARWIRSYLNLELAALPTVHSAPAHLLVLAASALALRTLLACSLLPGRTPGRLSVLVPASTLAAHELDGLRRDFASATVNIGLADFDDPNQLEATLAGLEAEHGPIKSVYCRLFEYDDLRTFVHKVAPQQLHQRLLLSQTRLAHLATVFQQRDINQILIFSSVITALAGIGASAIFAGYTALDEAVEALANQSGMRWIAIDGEGWFEQALLPGGFTADGRSAVDNPGVMTLEELASVIDHTVQLSAMASTRVIAAPMSIPAREEWVRRNILKHNRLVSKGPHAKATLDSIAAAPDGMLPAAPHLTNAAPAARTAAVVAAPSPNSTDGPFLPGSTTARLATIIKGLTGAQIVDAQQMLYGAGWDSLVVLQAFPRIRAEFHLDVPIRSLLEVATLSDLSALIDNQQPDSPRDESSASFDSHSSEGLAQMLLARLHALSDDEVEQQLAEQGYGYAPGAGLW